MATFRQIRGQTIKKYTTNPTTPLEGQIWYNSTAGTLKGALSVAAAWASGTAYPVPIQDVSGAGITTAAIYYGGYSTPDAHTAKSNEFDGSSWTATPDLNSGRVMYQVGTGTQTAALGAGGASPALSPNPTALSEEWNGSTWAVGNILNTARSGGTGGGTQTSALLVGGSGVTNTESYNGTSWSNETAAPDVAFASRAFSGQSETSNIFIGVLPSSEDTYSYDGTSWSDLSKTLVTGQNSPTGGSQQGTSTAAVIAGGFSPAPAIVGTGQIYDGSAWATTASLATARRGGGAAGTAAACFGVGGEEPARSDKTEEYTGAYVGTVTVTTS